MTVPSLKRTPSGITQRALLDRATPRRRSLRSDRLFLDSSARASSFRPPRAPLKVPPASSWKTTRGRNFVMPLPPAPRRSSSSLAAWRSPDPTSRSANTISAPVSMPGASPERWITRSSHPSYRPRQPETRSGDSLERFMCGRKSSQRTTPTSCGRSQRQASNTYSCWETMAVIRRRWNRLHLVSTPSCGRMGFASSSSGTGMQSPRRKSRPLPRAGTSWARGMVVYGIRRSSGRWHPQRSGFRCSRSETRRGLEPWTRGELRVTPELPHPHSVASSGRSGSATRLLKSVPCWRPSPLPRE